MSFVVGDIPFFKEYQFTDTGKIAPHFALVLLPEIATRFQNSLLCCVITSRDPQNKWSLLLKQTCYVCFTKDSYACFDRKDLVANNGLGFGSQPKGRLNSDDLLKAYKKLKRSLYAIPDIASAPYMKGTIIYTWKKALGLI